MITANIKKNLPGISTKNTYLNPSEPNVLYKCDTAKPIPENFTTVNATVNSLPNKLHPENSIRTKYVNPFTVISVKTFKIQPKLKSKLLYDNIAASSSLSSSPYKL